jgi:hypothetical protein
MVRLVFVPHQNENNFLAVHVQKSPEARRIICFSARLSTGTSLALTLFIFPDIQVFFCRNAAY